MTTRFGVLATVSASTMLAVFATALPAAAQSAADSASSPKIATGVYDRISDILISGNQRVEPQTIMTYVGISRGDEFDPAEIDRALKNLFATGFFKDVKLLREGNNLVIEVQENPVINRVAFEGNENVETKDLESEIELTPRSIYTRAKVQSDVRRILDIYRRSGRYSATVEPKIIELDQNRIDLVYEINDGPVAQVEKIIFIGNEKFSSSDLLGVINTSEEAWWRFLTESDKYDPDRLQYDQELLRRFYLSQGYADFQVRSAHAELSPNKDAFYLTFVIEEGDQYTLSLVDVESKLDDGEAPNFDDIILTDVGDIYDAGAVEETIDLMTQELGNRGYAFVDIVPKLKRNPEQDTAELVYSIEPGPRVYVERINIGGNVRTLDRVIRREFRVAEGDPYSTSKISRTEQRLNNLGFFENVEVKTEQGSAPDKTVIDVDVQEKSTGEINMGAGFSSADGALADFGIRETNLLGRGQELRTRVTYASRRKQVELGFTEPYFLNRELSAGFDIYRTRLDFQTESSYDIDSNGINLRMGYAIREHLLHNLNYSYRSNDITDVKPFASRFIRDQQGENVNSSVGHSITYDKRNNRFNPTNGYYLRFSQEFAGVGGDSKYLRHELKSSYYYPFTKDWVFSIGGAGGHMFSFGGRDILISDRFFVGGELIRGFDNSGIGPRDTTTRDALGGNFYYAGTLEQRFPLGLPEELGLLGAAFLDFGSLWQVDASGPEVADNNTLRASFGVGVSWNSPFGPIRIDVAKPIVKEKFDEEELLRFSFGTRF